MSEEYINNRIQNIFGSMDNLLETNCGYILKKLDSHF